MVIDTVVKRALGEQPAAGHYPNGGFRRRVSAATKWANGQYGSKESYEGTGLEAIVDDALAKYGLQNGVADFCYMFFSPQDALLANSRKERAILAYKLGVFLYMAGVIPRTLPDGEVRRLGPQIQDLAFMGYSYFANIKKRTGLESVAVDKPFSRLMMAVVKRATDPLRGGPSVEEIIDEVGSHPLIAQRYGRAVSYDDILPVWEVMRRYQTGQRAVTIRIGSRSMQMTPETLDDFWVLNPEFIKLKQDMLLFYFWKRVGKEQWEDLVNQTLQRKRVIEYLGTTGATVTYEAIKSNPKAKYIKRGALPSRELGSDGGMGMGTARGRPRGSAKAENGNTATVNKPTYAPAHASLEDFRGYVPSGQLADATFMLKLREETRREGPPNMARALQLAQEVGVKTKPGKSIEDRIKGLIRESGDYVILEKLGTDPRHPDEYIWLEKFLGEKGERVKKFFYTPLEQAVQEILPDYNLRAVHQLVGGVITVLQQSNIETQGDLEELLQKGWGGIQAVKGLVNEEPHKAYRLACFLRACQIKGYEVPPEAVAASPLKYFGKDSKPVKDDFRPHVEQAVREAHPDWNEKAVHNAAGGVIYALETNGIVFMPDLEKLAQQFAQEGISALQEVKGLVNKDPTKRTQLNYATRALELAGLYTLTQPPSQAVAAAPPVQAATS